MNYTSKQLENTNYFTNHKGAGPSILKLLGDLLHVHTWYEKQ